MKLIMNTQIIKKCLIFIFFAGMSEVSKTDDKNNSQESFNQTKDNKKIKIVGNENISNDSIMDLILDSLTDGDIDDNIAGNQMSVAEIRLKVANSGLFESVRVYKDKEHIIVQVKELPVIYSVSFSGNSLFKNEKCLEIADIKPGQVYNEYKVRYAQLRLRQAYMMKFANADIKIEKKIQTANDSKKSKFIELVFNINESKSGGIYNLAVESVENKSDKKINEKNLKAGDRISDRMLSRAIPKDKLGYFTYGYDINKIDLYRKMLLDYAQARGFNDFMIERADIVPVKNSMGSAVGNELLGIRFIVQQGKRYFVNDVIIDSKVEVSQSEMIKLQKLAQPFVNMSKNKKHNLNILNIKELDSICTQIQEFFYKKGVYVDVSYNISSNSSSSGNLRKVVDLKFIIKEGKQAVLNNITITGNNHSAKETILTISGLVPGQHLNRVMLQRAKSRLERVGFFNSADFDLNQNGDIVDLLIKLDERKTLNLKTEMNIGYGVIGPMMGKQKKDPSLILGFNAGYNTQNLFGQGYNLNAELGITGSMVHFDTTIGQSPLVSKLNLGWLFGLNVYWVGNASSYNHANDSKFDLKPENNYLMTKEEYKDKYPDKEYRKAVRSKIDWETISASPNGQISTNLNEYLTVGVGARVIFKNIEMQKNVDLDYMEIPEIFNEHYMPKQLLVPEVNFPIIYRDTYIKERYPFGFKVGLNLSLSTKAAKFGFDTIWLKPLNDAATSMLIVKLDGGIMRFFDHTQWQFAYHGKDLMTGIASWGARELTSMNSLGGQEYLSARAKLILPFPYLDDYVRFYSFVAAGTVGNAGLSGYPNITDSQREKYAIKDSWTQSIVNDDHSLRLTTGVGFIFMISENYNLTLGYNIPLIYNQPFDYVNYVNFGLSASLD